MNRFLTQKEFGKQYDLIEDIDLSIISVICKEELDHKSKESYPYIPNHYFESLYFIFSNMWEYKHKYPRSPIFKLSLLDVGAGSGRIVALAKACGIQAKGVEFHAPYVELGRKFYELSEDELIVGNAFDLKNDFLKQFSVIYTYMPIRNDARMAALHFHLESQAGDSTTFIEMLPRYYPMRHFSMTETYKPFWVEKGVSRYDYPHMGTVTVEGYNIWNEKDVD
jgi:SAM-dependent methyltransferase